MNIKEYIESGVIESCVLGLATQGEQQELEALCIEYNEIVEARNAFELALEAQLMKAAVTPPPFLKEKIFRTIHNSTTNGSHKKGEKPQTPVRKLNIWKWVAAACIVLLAGTIYRAYLINDKYEQLLAANIKTANQPDHTSHAEAIMALKTFVEKPSVKWSAMVEPSNSAHCMAHVYWDTLSKNTFLLLGNIPKTASNKQFQLWALINNQSVDLGVFDIKKEGQFIQMKSTQNAKTFAITIEPRGGSTAPDMNAMYALGEF